MNLVPKGTVGLCRETAIHNSRFAAKSDTSPASNGSELAARSSSALPSRDRVLHPGTDRSPKGPITNGGSSFRLS
jgi:hypothetical protein